MLAIAPFASAQVALPIDFEQPVNYELTDFGGNASSLVADPTDAGNTVVQSIRTAKAACFAGTTVADATGFTSPIPFAPDATTMSVRVWSPEAGIRVLFKVEKVGAPEINVETFAFTTAAGAWETIVFDFGNPMPNMNPINFDAVYDKASIFFDFQCNLPGAPMAERTYYWDDVTFGGTAPPPPPPPSGAIALPVTFEDGDAAFYELTDFGGNASSLVADPTDASNTVVQSIRTAEAACFAGTTVADATGFTSPIPFAPGATTMSVRVWSPEAGIRVLFKVEKVGSPEINVETLGTTTVAAGWETIVFDFANPMPNMNPIDFNAVYDKASIFFDFSCDAPPPAAPPARTYFWDDVSFGADTPPPPPPGGVVALPVTFEDGDAAFYELTDFGGNASSLVADPTDASNTVVQSIRTAGAAFFAGTTVADATGFTAPIPFAKGATTMSVRVWSQEAGVPVRLKVEKVGDAGVSVEAEVLTTVADMWETLVYDFANEVPGTAELNLASEYTKASLFFNFQTPEAPALPEQTYYWDDLAFGSGVMPPPTGECDYDFTVTNLNGTTVPTEGGRIRYKFEIDNSSNSEAAAVDIWGAASITGSAEPFFVRSPRAFTVPAGAIVRFGYNQRIPGYVPDGSYTYEVMAGTFGEEVCGTQAYTIMKGVSTAGASEAFAKSGQASAAGWNDIEIVDVEMIYATEAETGVRVGPNPVRDRAVIAFDVETESQVSLVVYDALGREVSRLIEGSVQAGTHRAQLDATALQTGTYVYRLSVNGSVQTGRLTVVR